MPRHDARRWLVGPISLLVATAAVLSSCAATEDDTDDWDMSEDVEGVSIRGAWAPPPDVRAAGDRQTVAYVRPPRWDGGANCAGGLLPGTRTLGDYIDRVYPGAGRYEGYVCRQNTGNLAETSVHGTGRALDVYVPLSGGAADNTLGDPIANWLVQNAQAIGIQLVIWDRTSYSPARPVGSRFRAYTGPHPHHDHLHIELTPDAAAQRTAWFSSPSGGAIPAFYASLGGASSFLGTPTTPELRTPNRPGAFQHYSHNASIYWSPATGAREVHGLIREKWQEMGWENSVLAFPTTNEQAAARGGRYNRFQGGSIFWHIATGAHEVHGSIERKWRELGGSAGRLGFPTTDEYGVQGGRRSDFEGGSIVWTAATGAVRVIYR